MAHLSAFGAKMGHPITVGRSNVAAQPENDLGSQKAVPQRRKLHFRIAVYGILRLRSGQAFEVVP
jgi:hypothetical protein